MLLPQKAHEKQQEEMELILKGDKLFARDKLDRLKAKRAQALLAMYLYLAFTVVAAAYILFGLSGNSDPFAADTDALLILLAPLVLVGAVVFIGVMAKFGLSRAAYEAKAKVQIRNQVADFHARKTAAESDRDQ